MSAEVERFAARSGERFPFLAPGRLKDAAGLRPGEPGYNPRTLYIPKTWFKDQKVRPRRSALRHDQGADQAIGIIDRRANQIDR